MNQLVQVEPKEEGYISSILASQLNNGIYEYQQNKIGKILTIIDASVSDHEQRKAMKDLIKEVFYSSYLSATGVDYCMASLARVLKKHAQSTATEDDQAHAEYMKAHGYDVFGNILEKKLADAKLG